MSKHITDHEHAPETSSRTAQYTRIEREQQQSQASKALHRQSHEGGDGRVKNYTKIERSSDA